MYRIQLSFILILGFLPQYGFTQVSAIKELKNVKPRKEVFQVASQKKPLIISDARSAAKYFDQDVVKAMLPKIDFNKQVVIVFAWRGSGQDKLEVEVKESFPEQIDFRYRPGRTRDLREHIKVYSVRSNVIWQGKPIGRAKADLPRDSIRVEIKGKISQVFAIGGETTGVQITANGVTWELDFNVDRQLRAMAENLDGKQVVVKGELYVKKGIEIAKRTIVKVRSLEPAK